MEVGTLVEVCRWGFSILVVIYCFLILFKGLKDISEIDKMKDR